MERNLLMVARKNVTKCEFILTVVKHLVNFLPANIWMLYFVTLKL